MSRFTFNNRASAEEIVKNLATKGKTVVIDLTSAPLDTLSREPKFLGVYGEPVLQISQAQTIIDGVVTPLLPFSQDYGTWRSVTPQGADEELRVGLCEVHGVLLYRCDQCRVARCRASIRVAFSAFAVVVAWSPTMSDFMASISFFITMASARPA